MENPSYYQEGKQIEKGKIDLLSNGQRLITLFQTADESTFAHEMGHMFLMDLEELAKIDDKSAKELGITPAYAGKTGSALLLLFVSRDHPRLRGKDD